jgi:hypothetical protein
LTARAESGLPLDLWRVFLDHVDDCEKGVPPVGKRRETREQSSWY